MPEADDIVQEPSRVDLLVAGAELVATMDGTTEVPGGWVAIDGGFVVGVGPAGREPAAGAHVTS